MSGKPVGQQPERQPGTEPGKRRSPRCPDPLHAHPALSQQIPQATLGLDIEGGAHRGPAGADSPGATSAEQASWARRSPQSRSGSQAAQSAAVPQHAGHQLHPPGSRLSPGSGSALLRFQGSSPRRGT